MRAAEDPGQPGIGPGVPQVGSNAPRSAAGSNKAGSLLFFPKYTSDLASPNHVNTLLTITNTNPRDAVSVRVFFVHDCMTGEVSISLVANQSRTLLASRESPGQTGYAMAMAVNSQGLPTQFNWLIGNAALRDGRGHEASFNAFAVARRSAGPVAFNSGAQTADLVFDNVEYDRLPKRVAIDNVQNQDEGTGPAQKTDVSLVSPGSDLATMPLNLFTMTATAYDSTGKAFSKEQEITCGVNAGINQLWDSFSSVIGANRAGWAGFRARNSAGALPLIGLSLTDGVDEPLHSARVMQALEWLDTFRMTVPTRVPDNPVADSATTDLPEAVGGGLGASESRAGSILLYPRIVSGGNGTTQIHLTNTHPTEKARIRVFFSGLADPAEVRDSILTLPAQQTRTLEADDLFPGQRGWIMVVAIDNRALPIQFNHLIGSAQVNETNGQRASLNAIAIGKNDPNPLARGEGGVTADLLFDGVNYDQLQAMTAMAFVPSQADNSTTLGISRPPLTMLGPPNTRGVVSVTLYDELLASFGGNVTRTESKLNQIRSAVNSPPITNSLQSGQHGWVKLSSRTPAISWSLNMATAPFQTTGTGWQGGFSGDGNLHFLTLADTHTISVPAVNPGNHPPVAFAEMIGLQVEARRGDGTIVRLDGSPSEDEDPDDPLTFQWFDRDLPISTARIADRRLNLGTHEVKLIVTDGSGAASDPDVQSVNVVDTTPPRISGLPSSITKVTDSETGEAINFALPVAYDMVDGALPVISSRLPGSVFPIGRTVVTFKARDNSGNEAMATLNITLTRGNPTPLIGGDVGSKTPVMDNLNDQYVRPGEVRNLLLQAADADGDPVTYTLQGAPSYAQIISGDPAARNATLRIAPSAGETAVATNVRVLANDGRGQIFTTLPFRIILSEVPNDDTGSGVSLNLPPVPVIVPIESPLQATSRSGAVVTLDASGSRDPEGDPMTFTWYDGDTVIGRGPVVVVPLAVGTHSIRLTIFDGKDGTTTSAPMSIEVLPRPLAALAASPAILSKGTTVAVTITGAGFQPGAEVQFTKEGLTVLNYVSIEEDKIVATVVVSATPTPGYRDIFVFNPNGASARLRSGLYVNR
ncbi:MAG: HYR domain-containing protein [Blastocatellia bacterium]|nr:HYR domain-containing protein [Blastocatellia bacterium]